jgi:hypothetical protein
LLLELLAEVEVVDEPLPELLPHATRAPLTTSVATVSGTRRCAFLMRVIFRGSFLVIS